MERKYKIVENYLSRNYGILDILQILWILVLRYAKIPLIRSWLFFVAGLVVVWLRIDSPILFNLQIGDFRNRKSYEIKANLAADLKPFHILCVKTLDQVRAKLFFNTKYIMFFTNRLIIKLPKKNVKNHFAQMSTLLPFFDNYKLLVHYINRPMILAPHSRLKILKLELYNSEFDNTDYIKKLCVFFCGAMLRYMNK